MKDFQNYLGKAPDKLDKEPGDLGMTLQAKTRRRLPVVLSTGEVVRLFDEMQGTGRTHLEYLDAMFSCVSY